MPNIKFTVQERINMVLRHARGETFKSIAQHFAEEHPGRPLPAPATVRKVILKYRETGVTDPRSVKTTYPTRRLTAVTKEQVLEILEKNGKKPASKVAREVGISKASVRRIIEEVRVLPNKCRKVQKLGSTDDESPVIPCETMKNELRKDEGIRHICFSDESTILLVGTPNSQNLRFYSTRNPHLIIEENELDQPKLNVWAGVYLDQIVGPFFIEGDLDGDKYLTLLQEHIVPAIRALEGNGPKIWFQQDGTPAHFSTPVRRYLDIEFPNRWIGPGGAIQWPDRSPDLTPLELGLWAYVKSKIYVGGRLNDLPALQARILEILADMTPQTISNTTQHFQEFDRSMTFTS